jgi:thiamine pyrophosphokinase
MHRKQRPETVAENVLCAGVREDGIMTEYAIIIAGGRIDDDFALRFIQRAIARKERPLLIAADKGLVFLERNGIVPDVIVGDFDSVPEGYEDQYLSAHPQVEVHKYRWEKDYTDTEIAARRAVEKGCKVIDFLGATGTRFDHMLGCVQLLALLLDRGVVGRILDPYNRITMHQQSFRIMRKEQWGKYVSLFAWGGELGGVTLTGFHFPMENGRITTAETLTVSNEIGEESAEVRFESGMLLMVESKDRPG